MPLLATAICLIACHGGPAEHFAAFADALEKEGHQIEIYASGPALKKFEERGIKVTHPFVIEGLTPSQEEALASQIAKSCTATKVVMTDLGAAFDVTLQKALMKEAPTVERMAYYDNPEPYVPGGYSKIAAEVMQLASRVLFANSNLEKASLYEAVNQEVNLPFSKRSSIGYYPKANAEKLALKREKEGKLARERFFTKYNLEDRGQKVFVYFGGNNTEYFERAFPAFIQFLEQAATKNALVNTLFVLQQHPGAKINNIDRKMLESWMKTNSSLLKGFSIVISNETTDDMQIVVQSGLYYQTSMGPLYAIAGIPLIQVAHKTYLDVLVTHHLCPSATTPESFIQAVGKGQGAVMTPEQRLELLKSLGIREDWVFQLKSALHLVNNDT